MRSRNDTFTLAVTGTGRLVAMFFTECSKGFPKATLYDRTSSINQFRGSEAALGKTAYASPEFRRESIAIEKNLAKPSPVNVTVNFEQRGPMDAVTVSGQTVKRTFNFNVETAGRIDVLVAYVTQIVAAVGQTD